jgi:hypothetical protein
MNVNDPLARVFEITRLNTVFEINSEFIAERPRVLMAA